MQDVPVSLAGELGSPPSNQDKLRQRILQAVVESANNGLRQLEFTLSPDRSARWDIQ